MSRVLSLAVVLVTVLVVCSVGDVAEHAMVTSVVVDVGMDVVCDMEVVAVSVSHDNATVQGVTRAVGDVDRVV